MVKDEAAKTILSILGECIVDGDIKCIPTNNWLKYHFKIRCGYSTYNIQLAYEFIDSYYRISIEYIDNTQSENVIFLTRSKIFHKKIKKFLNTNKLNKKSVINHIIAVSTILKDSIFHTGNSCELMDSYPHDLKFDGYFI